jgi:hypothetical protein
MNRFVIEPVFACPTKRYQLAGELFHRLRTHSIFNTQAAKGPGPAQRLGSKPDRVPTTCLPAPTTSRFGRDQAQCYAICALDN